MSNQPAHTQEAFSRDGSVKLPAALITDAELDTIEAEVLKKPVTTDAIGILVSVLSAVAVVMNTVNAAEWWKNGYLLSTAGVALMAIGLQGARFCMAISPGEKSKHQANAERYIKSMRDLIAKVTQVPAPRPASAVGSPSSSEAARDSGAGSV